ncbi:hypothetical protein WDA79_07765 [Streptomyces sp. A475]
MSKTSYRARPHIGVPDGENSAAITDRTLTRYQRAIAHRAGACHLYPA